MLARRLPELLCCSVAAFGAEPGYNDAVARMRAGDWPAACGIADRLVREQPGFYAGHNLAGLCAAHNGNRPAAERSFRKSIALNPKFADSRNNLAIELLRRGERTEALAEFKASLRIDPKNVTALYNLGRIELDNGSHDRALPRLTLAASLAPTDVPIRIALAEAFAMSGNHARAREVLRQQPVQAGELVAMARAASAQGRYANARAILAGLDPDPEHAAEWNAVYGYASYKLGAPEQAERSLRRAIELNPQQEEYWLNMGELLLFHQSFEAAVAFLTTGLAQLPDSARLHLGLGVALLAAGGRDTDAIEHMETALQIRPDLEPARSALCQAYHQVKEWKQLERTASLWLGNNPQSSAAHYYRAVVLLEGDSKDLHEAERLLRQSVGIDPQFAPSRIALGKLLNDNAKPREALAEFRAALAASPQDAGAQYQLALTYRKLGELDKSRSALAAFQKMKAKQDSWETVFQLSKYE